MPQQPKFKGRIWDIARTSRRTLTHPSAPGCASLAESSPTMPWGRNWKGFWTCPLNLIPKKPLQGPRFWTTRGCLLEMDLQARAFIIDHGHCGSLSLGFPRSDLFFFKKGKLQYPSGNPWKMACSSRFNGRPGHARWPTWPANYLLKHSKIWEALVASASPHLSWQVANVQILPKRMVFGGFPRNTSSTD